MADQFWTRLKQTLRLMVGVHDYDAYVAHMRQAHPDHEPMNRDAFFRACIDARYPGKHGRIGKCPC